MMTVSPIFTSSFSADIFVIAISSELSGIVPSVYSYISMVHPCPFWTGIFTLVSPCMTGSENITCVKHIAGISFSSKICSISSKSSCIVSAPSSVKYSIPSFSISTEISYAGSPNADTSVPPCMVHTVVERINISIRQRKNVRVIMLYLFGLLTISFSARNGVAESFDVPRLRMLFLRKRSPV